MGIGDEDDNTTAYPIKLLKHPYIVQKILLLIPIFSLLKIGY